MPSTSPMPRGLYGDVHAGNTVPFNSANGKSRVLVTGAAGFIGMHLCERLAKDGVHVVGLDNFNGYYSPAYKRARAAHLQGLAPQPVHVVEGDVCDDGLLKRLLQKERFTHVAHLAGQPGVRYSMKHPDAYVRNNVECYVKLINALIAGPNATGAGDVPYEQPFLLYASSSSVYGLNTKAPFSESDRVDRPANLYGATKRNNEETALAYHNTHGLRSIGTRFFTVYGPWGRPDMAMYKFADSIQNGRPITVYNGGDMSRDFTYVSDIVEGIVRLLQWRSTSDEPQVFNLGNNQPVTLKKFIRTIEVALNKTANIVQGGPSKGEVPATFADVRLANSIVGFSPSVGIEEGVKKFVDWYLGPDQKPEFGAVAS